MFYHLGLLREWNCNDLNEKGDSLDWRSPFLLDIQAGLNALESRGDRLPSPKAIAVVLQDSLDLLLCGGGRLLVINF